MPGQTPSQTIGPFFSHALTLGTSGHRPVASSIVADTPAHGTEIRIEGSVVDGTGEPVTDGMVELWQADAAGRHRSGQGFRGFGRCGTDTSGRFRFLTVKPGASAPGTAPHLHLAIFARGMLNHGFTRAYFSDEAEANNADPVLNSVPSARRQTLIARRRPGESVYDFRIVLQGEQETVFFDA